MLNSQTRIWLLGSFCVLLTLLMTGYNSILQKRIILHDARSDVSNLAHMVESDLVRTFSGLEQIFMGLEGHLTPGPSGKPIDPPEIKRIIDNLTLDNSYLSALMIVDPNGRILHWSNNFQKPNLRQREYFQAHLQNSYQGLFFSLPQQSIINQGSWVCGVSKAIRNSDHSLKMVLVAIINLKYFERHYRPLLTLPGTSITITSPEGYLYTQVAERESIPGQQLTDLTATNGNVIDSGQNLSITMKVGHYPLRVTVARDKASALFAWQNSSRNYIVLGLILCLALLFMTWRTALSLGRQQDIMADIYEQAGIDPLTQLADQQHSLDLAHREIKKAVRTKLPLSLILLNLDHFKAINEKYGRPQGDTVLQGTAGLLRECSRETDILGRYSGVCFMLLLPDTDLSGAVVLARKIHEQLAQKKYPCPGGECYVTASFGVSQWAVEEDTIDEAIQRAETALFEGKQSGRNNIHWMPSGLGGSKIDNSIVWLHNKDRGA